VEAVPATDEGHVDLEALKTKLNDQVAAVMITNPNTCGLFEKDAIAIAEAVHAAGAYFYMDGANYNAIVGRLKIADLGVDAMHINLHKTFSTPHGGGGPGAGPTVLSAKLAPFAPVPRERRAWWLWGQRRRGQRPSRPLSVRRASPPLYSGWRRGPD
jgi:glycine dehydrogenase subunit 2